MKNIECKSCGMSDTNATRCPVCGTNRPAVDMDALVTAVTACGSWSNMRYAMDAGYVPTLSPRKLRSNASQANREWENKVAQLRDAVRAAGYRVYDGHKVA